jgi:hypothetical protein
MQHVLNNLAAYSDDLASRLTERFQLFTASRDTNQFPITI